MRLLVSKHNLGKWVAYYVYKKIIAFNPTIDKPFILGLPTGSTPLDMYQELIKLYEQGKLSFANVITFNLDEYVGLDKEHPQSYYYYMYNNFFNHIDIKPQNINILNGIAKDLQLECKQYEEKIKQLGGIDLLIGGVGEDGHIAFNEPSSSFNSITRIKMLNHSTILANSRFFYYDINQTPKLALTMGVRTILDAKEVVILAKGTNKANVVASVVEGSLSSMCPISALQLHDKSLILIDDYASYELRVKTVKYFDLIEDEYKQIDDELKHNF
jgi:glucosamine-6-phosphate deaminase